MPNVIYISVHRTIDIRLDFICGISSLLNGVMVIRDYWLQIAYVNYMQPIRWRNSIVGKTFDVDKREMTSQDIQSELFLVN